MTRPLLIKTQVVVTPEIVQNRKIYPGVLMPSLLAFGIRIVPLLLLKISRFLLAAFRHSLCLLLFWSTLQPLGLCIVSIRRYYRVLEYIS